MLKPLVVSSLLGSERGAPRTANEDKLLLQLVLRLVDFGLITMLGPGGVWIISTTAPSTIALLALPAPFIRVKE
jgi:hypothetical protein